MNDDTETNAAVDSEPAGAADLERLLQAALAFARRDDVPEEDDPLGRLSREFFANNWAECCDGLLQRTGRIRVWPEPSPAPRAFRFEIDCAYKAKVGDEPVELRPGPVRGQVMYRGDMFTNPDGPCVAVFLDRDQCYFHPNFNRERGILCLGDLNNLPPGPVPLERLLENHVFPIVSYQNRRPVHAADAEAARYFALEPSAMDGLESVEPLY
jgi:hypothetical protein